MNNPVVDLPTSEQLPSVTVRIQTKGFADGAWTGVGTGFVWREALAGDQSALFLVTNRHVVKDATTIGLTLQGTSPDGSRAFGPGRDVETQLGEMNIVYHPDPSVDLAILALTPIAIRLSAENFKPYFTFVSRDIIPNPDQIRSLSASHSVILVGYPNGVYDKANNLPIMRRGITAIPPWIDYQGSKDLLLDIATFGGSSGSPVFVLDEGVLTGRDGVNLGGSRLYFLGVLKAGHYRTEIGTIIQAPIPTAIPPVAHVQQMINLAVCVKAEQVIELVDEANKTFRLTAV